MLHDFLNARQVLVLIRGDLKYELIVDLEYHHHVGKFICNLHHC